MSRSKAWKKMELKVAKSLGTNRTVCSGVRGEGDVEHDQYYIECKYRKKFACRAWFFKAKAEAEKRGKTPLLIIKERGKHGELAVVDWEWLRSLIVDVEKRKDGMNDLEI